MTSKPPPSFSSFPGIQLQPAPSLNKRRRSPSPRSRPAGIPTKGEFSEWDDSVPSSSSTSHPSAPHEDRRKRISTSTRRQDLEDEDRGRKDWFVDGRGDGRNVTYGGNYKGDVPRYYRSGAGRVVGQPDELRINKMPSKGISSKEIEVSWRFLGDAVSSKHLKKADQDPSSLVRLLPKPSTHSAALAQFVRLPKVKARAEEVQEGDVAPYRQIVSSTIHFSEDEHGDDDSAGENEETSFRLFGQSATAAGFLEESEEEEEQEQSEMDIYRIKNVEFSTRLRENPEDVDGWLAWAKLSSSFTTTTPSKHGSPSNEEAKSQTAAQAGITLSFLTRAVEQSPTLSQSPKLMLALIDASIASGESYTVVSHRWKDALEGMMGRIEVWAAWTGWRMEAVADLGGGKEEGKGGVGWAVEALGMLKVWKEGLVGYTEVEECESIQVYILLRACLALKESGYSERAFAVMQAMIEISLFCPVSTAQRENFDSIILPEFEKFWESEVPRFGELGARGWFDSLDGTTEARPAPFHINPQPKALNSELQDPFVSWLAAEKLASSTTQLSSRLEDDGVPLPGPCNSSSPPRLDSDDPYRLVLFSDIQPLLFWIKSRSVKDQLVYSLFTFLDLPFTPPNTTTQSPFYKDPYLKLLTRITSTNATSSLLQRNFWPNHLLLEEAVLPRARRIGDAGMEPELEMGLGTPWDCPLKIRPIDVDCLMRRSGEGCKALEKGEIDDGVRPIVLNMLNLLFKSSADSNIALYSIAVEASNSPKTASKLAKNILSVSRDSLALWDGYARLERQRGRLDDARNVYVTALSMTSPSKIDGDGLRWKLIKSWFEMEFEAGDLGRATALVVESTSGNPDFRSILALSGTPLPLNPVSQLRTRKFFSNAINSSLLPTAPASFSQNTTNLVYISAAFEYITSSLDTAVSIYEHHLDVLSTHQSTIEQEETYIFYGSLLYKHSCSRKAFKPPQIRAVLERAISAFPNNTELLSLYLWSESRTRIQNRVRIVLDSKVLQQDPTAGPTSWIFAIWAEMWMVHGRHNEFSVRNLVRRAMEVRSNRASVPLWKVAIEHEIRVRSLARAKTLFYGAVRHCPWSKDLYLYAFGPLRSVFKANELEELSDLMSERKIRLRVEMSDFLEGWDENRFNGEVEDMIAGGLDELEAEMIQQEVFRQKENLMLMPY